MTGEDWSRLKEVFAEASERPAAERPAYLEEVCAGEPGLRREVESLLESADGAAGFMDEQPAGRDASPARPSDRIGAYRVVRELGIGGMGTVYLAERADGHVQSRVAMKIVKRGMDTRQILERFQHERQALANLNHPYIARFLDGGVTPDGLPYLAMEYVDGERIDAYCDGRRMPVRERLLLFRKVCAAVRYAHQNLVVHRDLKPSNILVTSEGEPRLLDFGLAKVLDPEVNGSHATTTMHRFLTPDYASPEQTLGKPLTTAGDVYSLGVMLYELLTGRRPHRLSGLSPAQVERVMTSEAPAPPSEAVWGRGSQGADEEAAEAGAGNGAAGAVRPGAGAAGELSPGEVAARRGETAERLRRRLRGDLDTIALTALHKDASRRYGSVEALDADVGRYLEGLRVLARKDTLAYRAVKFVRRHRASVTVGAVLTAAVLITGAVAVRQTVAAAHQREEAARALVKRERINGFMLDLLYASDPSALASETTLDDILDTAAYRAEVELGDQPDVMARLQGTLGRIYYTHGRLEDSVRALRTSLELQRDLYGERNAEVAETLHMLGAALSEAGEHGEAEVVLGEALSTGRALWGERDNRVAGILDDLSKAQRAAGRLDGAEASHKRAQVIYEETLGAEHWWVVQRRTMLADLTADRGDLAAAEAQYREIIVALERFEAENPAAPARPMVAMADVLRRRGEVDGAVAMLERAVRMLREAHPGGHPDVAEALSSLGRAQHDAGDDEGARRALRDAVEMQRRLLGEEHPAVLANVELLRALEGPGSG